MGVRSAVPALLLRLGRDQEAFDFISWYAQVPSDYEWGDTELSFLDLHGADALASFASQAEKMIYLSFLVAVTLIKTRLMLYLEFLQDAIKKVGGEASFEAKLAVLQEDAISDILLSRRDVLAQADFAELAATARAQVMEMYAIVKRRNEHFWPAIFNPGPYACALPGPYTIGSREEVVVSFRDSWYSWSESERAVLFIRGVIRGDLGGES